MRMMITFMAAALSAGAFAAELPRETPAVAPDVSSWHGANLLGLFNAAPQKPDKRIRGKYEECYFRWFKDWGFNFARLPMDYRYFLATNDWTVLKQDGFRMVDQAVAWGRKYGVHVQLCIHRAPGYTVTWWDPERQRLQTDAEPQAAFMRLWSEFARRYRGIPNSELSFNLVNEPTGFTEAQFVDVFGRTIDAIRKVDPGRFVMLDGNNTASTPVAHFYTVPLTGQAFRGYTPHAISHYKAWYIKQELECEPTWPFSGAMAKRKAWNLEHPATTLAKFAGPRKAGYPVMIGEFGCYNQLKHETCLKWMEDCLKLWKQEGLGWAIWNVDGPFGFMDSDRADVAYEDFEGHKLDRKMLELLQKFAQPAAPKFAWRGYMLDTSRHFFTVGEIKRALDAMQEVGLNVFHWHLTDSEGWRLEIERYPKLTSVGSVRRNGPRGSTMGDETVTGEYGPYFYTKAQVREIVAYAAARGIRVVPELDIPGHSAAAIRAYPELGCRGQGNNGELCLGRDATLETFENILREVMELFPGEVIHLGGDECSRRNWRKCPDCQARIRALGLRGEKGLQGWATARFARFLERNGRRMAGWDEIAEFDDMPRSAIVTAYRSSARGIDAAKKGFDVVFCPCEFCYLDYVQGLEGDPYEYQPFGCVLSAMKIAGFDPAAGCPAAARRHILGGQGNLWTELVCDWAGAEWRTWPRLAAIADVLANGPEKDAAAFAARLEKTRTKLKARGVNAAPIGPLFKERPDLEPGSRYTVFRPDFAKLLPTELSVASLCFDWNDGADAFRKVYARKDTSIPSGGYRLDLDWCRIEAEASDAAGFTNAVRQLRALARMKRGGAMEFPACRIENGDIPRRTLPVERMTGLRVFTNSVGKVMAYRWSAPRHPQLGLCYPMTVLMPGEGQMARAAEILNDQREKGVDAYFIAPLPGSPTEPLAELLERMKWEDRTLDAERIRVVRP